MTEVKKGKGRNEIIACDKSWENKASVASFRLKNYKMLQGGLFLEPNFSQRYLLISVLHLYNCVSEEEKCFLKILNKRNVLKELVWPFKCVYIHLMRFFK